ncbi:unnamed protein product [Amoebophrya sp. A120]|nr:unnamed protein product [Amoebophrya sp. A120]|eukprot:GSA120T00018389001.1
MRRGKTSDWREQVIRTRLEASKSRGTRGRDSTGDEVAPLKVFRTLFGSFASNAKNWRMQLFAALNGPSLIFPALRLWAHLAQGLETGRFNPCKVSGDVLKKMLDARLNAFPYGITNRGSDHGSRLGDGLQHSDARNVLTVDALQAGKAAITCLIHLAVEKRTLSSTTDWEKKSCVELVMAASTTPSSSSGSSAAGPSQARSYHRRAGQLSQSGYDVVGATAGGASSNSAAAGAAVRVWSHTMQELFGLGGKMEKAFREVVNLQNELLAHARQAGYISEETWRAKRPRALHSLRDADAGVFGTRDSHRFWEELVAHANLHRNRAPAEQQQQVGVEPPQTTRSQADKDAELVDQLEHTFYALYLADRDLLILRNEEAGPYGSHPTHQGDVAAAASDAATALVAKGDEYPELQQRLLFDFYDVPTPLKLVADFFQATMPPQHVDQGTDLDNLTHDVTTISSYLKRHFLHEHQQRVDEVQLAQRRALSAISVEVQKRQRELLREWLDETSAELNMQEPPSTNGGGADGSPPTQSRPSGFLSPRRAAAITSASPPEAAVTPRPVLVQPTSALAGSTSASMLQDATSGLPFAHLTSAAVLNWKQYANTALLEYSTTNWKLQLRSKRLLEFLKEIAKKGGQRVTASQVFTLARWFLIKKEHKARPFFSSLIWSVLHEEWKKEDPKLPDQDDGAPEDRDAQVKAFFEKESGQQYLGKAAAISGDAHALRQLQYYSGATGRRAVEGPGGAVVRGEPDVAQHLATIILDALSREDERETARRRRSGESFPDEASRANMPYAEAVLCDYPDYRQMRAVSTAGSDDPGDVDRSSCAPAQKKKIGFGVPAFTAGNRAISRTPAVEKEKITAEEAALLPVSQYVFRRCESLDVEERTYIRDTARLVLRSGRAQQITLALHDLASYWVVHERLVGDIEPGYVRPADRFYEVIDLFEPYFALDGVGGNKIIDHADALLFQTTGRSAREATESVRESFREIPTELSLCLLEELIAMFETARNGKTGWAQQMESNYNRALEQQRKADELLAAEEAKLEREEADAAGSDAASASGRTYPAGQQTDEVEASVEFSDAGDNDDIAMQELQDHHGNGVGAGAHQVVQLLPVNVYHISSGASSVGGDIVGAIDGHRFPDAEESHEAGPADVEAPSDGFAELQLDEGLVARVKQAFDQELEEHRRREPEATQTGEELQGDQGEAQPRDAPRTKTMNIIATLTETDTEQDEMHEYEFKVTYEPLVLLEEDTSVQELPASVQLFPEARSLWSNVIAKDLPDDSPLVLTALSHDEQFSEIFGDALKRWKEAWNVAASSDLSAALPQPLRVVLEAVLENIIDADAIADGDAANFFAVADTPASCDAEAGVAASPVQRAHDVYARAAASKSAWATKVRGAHPLALRTGGGHVDDTALEVTMEELRRLATEELWCGVLNIQANDSASMTAFRARYQNDFVNEFEEKVLEVTMSADVKTLWDEFEEHLQPRLQEEYFRGQANMKDLAFALQRNAVTKNLPKLRHLKSAFLDGLLAPEDDAGRGGRPLAQLKTMLKTAFQRFQPSRLSGDSLGQDGVAPYYLRLNSNSNRMHQDQRIGTLCDDNEVWWAFAVRIAWARKLCNYPSKFAWSRVIFQSRTEAEGANDHTERIDLAAVTLEQYYRRMKLPLASTSVAHHEDTQAGHDEQDQNQTTPADARSRSEDENRLRLLRTLFILPREYLSTLGHEGKFAGLSEATLTGMVDVVDDPSAPPSHDHSTTSASYHAIASQLRNDQQNDVISKLRNLKENLTTLPLDELRIVLVSVLGQEAGGIAMSTSRVLEYTFVTDIIEEKITTRTPLPPSATADVESDNESDAESGQSSILMVQPDYMLTTETRAMNSQRVFIRMQKEAPSATRLCLWRLWTLICRRCRSVLILSL